MNTTQIESAINDIATKLKGVKVGKWEFDDDFFASTGRILFSGKANSVEIEFQKTNSTLYFMPFVLIGELKLNVEEWNVSDIEPKVNDEGELYDLIMATVRGITKALR